MKERLSASSMPALNFESGVKNNSEIPEWYPFTNPEERIEHIRHNYPLLGKVLDSLNNSPVFYTDWQVVDNEPQDELIYLIPVRFAIPLRRAIKSWGEADKILVMDSSQEQSRKAYELYSHGHLVAVVPLDEKGNPQLYKDSANQEGMIIIQPHKGSVHINPKYLSLLLLNAVCEQTQKYEEELKIALEQIQQRVRRLHDSTSSN